MALLREVWTLGRFLCGLPAFLKKRMSLAEATAIVQQRLADRDRNFLHVLQAAAFDNPRSPYRTLLDLARFQFGDVARLVERDGIESALRVLRGEGVYVTFEEFKAREPMVRLFTRVVVPGSLPLVLSGLRLAANGTLLVTIAAEIVMADTGLGSLVWLAWETLRVELLYATLIVIALFGIALTGSITLLRRALVPWQVEVPAQR